MDEVQRRLFYRHSATEERKSFASVWRPTVSLVREAESFFACLRLMMRGNIIMSVRIGCTLTRFTRLGMEDQRRLENGTLTKARVGLRDGASGVEGVEGLLAAPRLVRPSGKATKLLPRSWWMKTKCRAWREANRDRFEKM
jgi:hypothetical protein